MGSVRRKCIMDPVEEERRKTHAILLQTLIQRYLQEDAQTENVSQKSFHRNNKYNNSFDAREMREN